MLLKCSYVFRSVPVEEHAQSYCALEKRDRQVAVYNTTVTGSAAVTFKNTQK